MNHKPYATLAEFREAMAEFKKGIPSEKYWIEWECAVESGWDKEEFEELYRDYVKSTQVQIRPGDDANKLKGQPLEFIGRYLLEKGGLAYQITSISDPSKWQVDGCGPVNKTAVLMCWGQEYCEMIGIQIYMEAKNHSEPLENNEFSDHYRRMQEHHCNLGVMISTSGYKIARGKGIAESVYIHSVMKSFHVLLVFQSLTAVACEEKAPLVVIQDALFYATNNMYALDKDVQNYYSPETCKKTALAEYRRLFPQS